MLSTQGEATYRTPQTASGELRNRFPKRERLHLKREVDRIFQQGEKAFSFPYRILFLIEPTEQDAGVAMMVVVPKRLFKRAVARNAQKRRLREAYRLQIHPLRKVAMDKNLKVQLIFLIVSGDEVPLQRGQKAVGNLIRQVTKKSLSYD